MIHNMLTLNESSEVDLERPLRPPHPDLVEISSTFMELSHSLAEELSYELVVVAARDGESK